MIANIFTIALLTLVSAKNITLSVDKSGEELSSTAFQDPISVASITGALQRRDAESSTITSSPATPSDRAESKAESKSEKKESKSEKKESKSESKAERKSEKAESKSEKKEGIATKQNGTASVRPTSNSSGMAKPTSTKSHKSKNIGTITQVSSGAILAAAFALI